MTEQEARTIVGALVAAFPKAVIERPTEEVYTTQIAQLQSVSTGRDAAQFIIRNYDEFPSIAAFRAQYMQLRKAQAEEQARHRGIEEPAAGPLPDWVRDFADRLGESEDDPDAPERQLADLEEIPAGRCDDCGGQSSSGQIEASRYRYAKLALCRPCALSRLRVKVSL